MGESLPFLFKIRREYAEMPGGNKNIRSKDGKPFTSENQPTKRRGKSILTLVKQKVYDSKKEIILKGVEIVNEDGDPTGHIVDVKVELKTDEALAAHYIKQMFKSDRVLMDFIDRESGKPTQPIKDVTESEPMTDEELIDELKSLGFDTSSIIKK